MFTIKDLYDDICTIQQFIDSNRLIRYDSLEEQQRYVLSYIKILRTDWDKIDTTQLDKNDVEDYIGDQINFIIASDIDMVDKISLMIDLANRIQYDLQYCSQLVNNKIKNSQLVNNKIKNSIISSYNRIMTLFIEFFNQINDEQLIIVMIKFNTELQNQIIMKTNQFINTNFDQRIVNSLLKSDILHNVTAYYLPIQNYYKTRVEFQLLFFNMKDQIFKKLSEDNVCYQLMNFDHLLLRMLIIDKFTLAINRTILYRFIQQITKLGIIMRRSIEYKKYMMHENIIKNLDYLETYLLEHIFYSHRSIIQQLGRFSRKNGDVWIWCDCGHVDWLKEIDLEFYFNSVQLLWNRCNTKKLEQHQLLPVRDDFEQLMKQQTVKSWIEFNTTIGYDVLYYVLFSFLISKQQHIDFVLNGNFYYTEFVNEPIRQFIARMTYLDKRPKNIIHINIDKDQIYQSFADLMQNFCTQAATNQIYDTEFKIDNLLDVKFYKKLTDKKQLKMGDVVFEDGVDIGGLTRYLFQEIMDNNIPQLSFIKRTNCGYYYFVWDESKEEQQQQKQIIEFAYFLGIIPLQKEQVRIPIKEELLIYLIGYDLIPFKDYHIVFNKESTEQIEKETEKETKMELTEYAYINHHNNYFLKGKRVLDIMRPILQQMWRDKKHTLSYDRVRSQLYDSEEIMNYKQIQNKMYLIVQGIDNEQRSEENRQLLQQKAEEKYELLKEILNQSDQQTFIKFIKYINGSIYNVNKMVTIYVDDSFIPTWSSCMNTFKI